MPIPSLVRLRRLLRARPLAGGDQGRIVIIPTASETADQDDPKKLLDA